MSPSKDSPRVLQKQRRPITGPFKHVTPLSRRETEYTSGERRINQFLSHMFILSHFHTIQTQEVWNQVSPFQNLQRVNSLSIPHLPLVPWVLPSDMRCPSHLLHPVSISRFQALFIIAFFIWKMRLMIYLSLNGVKVAFS